MNDDVMFTLRAGTIKRIWIDVKVLADNGPAWVIEEATGLCRRHHAREWALVGSAMGAGTNTEPLHPTGPVRWIETEAEVRFIP